MEIGMVQRVDIDQEMQQSYLDYAMSVIVSRALPDARDGLKPVQRRLLYSMYDMGVRDDSTYKKSARIVGEVLGKYHPHGDQAVYETMARLAQDFTMRNCLIDGQGNFGSIDGDPPAAMRYTEARLTSFSMDMIRNLERDTVDFARNFDDTLNEPVVLPAAIPNLLVNGSSGIAVGMATSIPPHNLGEVVDALCLLLENWEHDDRVGVADLMKTIQGPDFPTGGIILIDKEKNDMLAAYATGKGRISLRGRVSLEDMERGKRRILIHELPYQVNKASLIERIAELVRSGSLDGITDLRDESDRQGMRIVIELGKNADEKKLLAELYKRTPMQTTFSIALLALVNNEPRLLTLKQALRVYLEHRIEVIQRRSSFDLKKAEERLHIVEGLRKALLHLDDVIQAIRTSKDVDQARTRLIKRFSLSQIQAQAILDMQLRRLASLERKKIEDEYKELTASIKELKALLKSPAKIRKVVMDELLQIKTTYTDRRKTQIVMLDDGKDAGTLLTTQDLSPEQEVWVGVADESGLVRTLDATQPRLSGKIAPRVVIRSNTHHTLYAVSDTGRAAAVSVNNVPTAESWADGAAVHRVTPFKSDDKIVDLFSIPLERPGGFVLTVSRGGMVKKSSLEELSGPSSQLFTLAKINDGDELLSALPMQDEGEILLVTKKGMAIRFSTEDVRPMGLVAAGVNGIKLSVGDEVVSASLLDSESDILLLAEDGSAWRLTEDNYPLQGRYGQGVQACKLSPDVEVSGMMTGKKNQVGVVHFMRYAAQTLRLDDAPVLKRTVKGKKVVPVKENDRIQLLVPVRDCLGIWKAAPKKKSAKPKKTAK